MARAARISGTEADLEDDDIEEMLEIEQNEGKDASELKDLVSATLPSR